MPVLHREAQPIPERSGGRNSHRVSGRKDGKKSPLGCSQLIPLFLAHQLFSDPEIVLHSSRLSYEWHQGT
jgi:hypothetical protein